MLAQQIQTVTTSDGYYWSGLIPFYESLTDSKSHVFQFCNASSGLLQDTGDQTVCMDYY